MARHRNLGVEVARIERELRALQTEVRNNFTLRSGSQIIYDEDGNVRQIIGLQPDGTYTHQEKNAPPPPMPSQPTVEGILGAIKVTWDGQTHDFTVWPDDFDHIEVHVSTTSGFTPTDASLQTTMESIKSQSAEVAALEPGGIVHFVRLVAVNHSGAKSDPTAQVSGTPTPAVSKAELDAVQQAADAAQADADAASAAASTAQTAADDASAAASAAQTTADGKNTIFYNNVTAGDPTPTATTTGDLWFKPDQGYAVFEWDGTAWTAAPYGSDALGDDAVIARTIAADQVLAGHIAADQINANHIVADAIQSTHIAADQVLAAHIAAGQIQTDHIAARQITAAKIAAASITAYEIAGNTITAAEIAGNTITASEIQAGAISTSELATYAVTADKISSGAITADKISANAIDGQSITGCYIYGNYFRSSNGTGYVEMGDTGYNDPVDEVRFHNSYTVSSVRNPSNNPGSVYMSLSSGQGLQVKPTPDGNVAIQKNFSGVTIKFRAVGNGISVVDDNGTYEQVLASNYATPSLLAFKNDVQPASIDAAAVLKQNGLHTWKWKSSGKPGVGLIADDLPDLVRTAEGYDVVAVVAFLWEALKQTNARLEVLEARDVTPPVAGSSPGTPPPPPPGGTNRV